MAERTGLEPATPCVTGRYSNRLNYRSTEFLSYYHQMSHSGFYCFEFGAWQFPTLAWGDPTLPSALRRFTSEFGMGSGGTTALVPPGIFCFINRHVIHITIDLKSRFKLKINILVSQPKHLRCCKVKPHGSLVLVSSTYRYAYTPSLSTS